MAVCFYVVVFFKYQGRIFAHSTTIAVFKQLNNLNKLLNTKKIKKKLHHRVENIVHTLEQGIKLVNNFCSFVHLSESSEQIDSLELI